MSQIVLSSLEKTIKKLALDIRKEDKLKAEQINALAKLVQAYNQCKDSRWDPELDGNPFCFQQIEEENHQTNGKKLIKRKKHR